jgi:hypothetical protein
MGGHGVEIGFSGQLTAQAANRVFDAALLPGQMGVAEVRMPNRWFSR